MKALFYTLALLFCLCISSCTNQSRIPETRIKKLATEELNRNNLLNQYATITVGYYEENDENERYILRKLAAAGVLTYKVDRIESKTRIRDGYSYDYNTYRLIEQYKTVTRYKYFVETALTAKGDSLSVDSIPIYEDKPDKYLQILEKKVYPEDSVLKEERFSNDDKPTESEEKTQVEDQKTIQEPEKSEPKTEYEKAKAMEHKEIKYVKSHSLKVTDARNIFIRNGSGKADVIVDSYDVSPFGRILSHEREGRHSIWNISLTYYQDKGWVLTELDD